MSKIYFPILMGRLGEIEAASRLSPRAKARSRLMFDPLLPRKGVNVEDHLSTILQCLRSSWGTSSAFYLDLTRYGPEHVTSRGELGVVFAYRCAKQLGLLAVPVSGPLSTRGPGSAYVEAVRSIAEDAGTGVAIRIPFDLLLGADTLESGVDECLSRVGVDESQVDLYLDYGAISTLPTPFRTFKALTAIVSEALTRVAYRSFRQLVVAGSSIPNGFKAPADGAAHIIPRIEMEAWSSLIIRGGNPVGFGDYGARYAYQTEPEGPVIPPSRVHIADLDDYVLYRADREAHRATCSEAAQSDRFELQSSCWGRAEIVACGLGIVGVGTPQDWAARDTNLHIESTVRILERILDRHGKLPQLVHDETDTSAWEQLAILVDE